MPLTPEQRQAQVDEVKSLIETYSKADLEADAADEVYLRAVSDLDDAHSKAAILNGNAEQQFALDQQAAQSAFDAAISQAKNTRTLASQAADKLVEDAQSAEHLAGADRDDAREAVNAAFKNIEAKLLALAAA